MKLALHAFIGVQMGQLMEVGYQLIISSTTVKKIKFIKKEDSYFNWSESGIGKKVVRRTVPLTTKKALTKNELLYILAFNNRSYQQLVNKISLRRCINV
ncbi:MAG: hypothetical protein ABIK21_06135 [bacterium]